jgi:vesicle coat complex subunit
VVDYQVRAYLSSSKESEKSKGMKFLLANMSKGGWMAGYALGGGR